MKITLTKKEIDEAKRLAILRDGPKKTNNTWNKKVSSLDNHFFGLKCEMAVAKYLGVEIDKTMFGTKGDEQKPDLFYKGLGIEVKGRTSEKFDFALTKNDISLFKSDIGVLCYKVSDDEIGIHGYITKDDFIKHHTVENYGYGNRKVVSPDKFTPLENIDLLIKPKAKEGLKIGKLTLDKVISKNNRKVYWKVDCDCGHSRILTFSEVKKKRKCGNCLPEEMTMTLNLIDGLGNISQTKDVKFDTTELKTILKTAYQKAIEKIK